jgi:riboflavin biosynthesis pyrimidine reductase
LATRLIKAGVVDRLEWVIAPRLFGSGDAVPAVAGDVDSHAWHLDRVECLGEDTRLSLRPKQQD